MRNDGGQLDAHVGVIFRDRIVVVHPIENVFVSTVEKHGAVSAGEGREVQVVAVTKWLKPARGVPQLADKKPCSTS
jgi:hypothetical protein